MDHQYTPLDSTQHRQHGWKRQPDFLFARTDVVAPLLLAEIPYASAVYVLGFAQRPAGGYQLVALQGLRPGENLFVDDAGRWLREYVPSHYRAYPFRILQAQQGDKTVHLLGFDRASGLYSEHPDPEQSRRTLLRRRRGTATPHAQSGRVPAGEGQERTANAARG